MRNRILFPALLLTACLAAASCGSTEATSASGTTQVGSAETETEAVTEAEPAFIDSLGEYDYGGENFNMLIRATRVDGLYVEDAIGEVYNDAVYERNTKIEERFNVKITQQSLDDDSSLWNKQISASVMAGDGAYDVVMPDYWWGCETGGYFLNLLDYSDIMDFSQPWWCAGWNDNSEIYGQMYSAVGSLCIDIYSNTLCTFFNKAMIESYDMESPYDMVDNHTWTLDNFLTMASQAGSDLNGDGVLDLATDNYGAYYELQAGRALFTSFGWKCSTKQEDGTYAYEFWGDDFVELYDRIYQMINATDYICYAGDAPENAFKTNRLLFFNTGMGNVAALRDMDSDFGIVPYPLYDESQENYISYNYGTFYMAIPRSAADPEKSAVLLEALNAESYHTVKDAYYEVNMKEKYSRDETTQRMLDLIVDSLYFDFTFVNETATDHIVMYFFNQVADKKENITSAYEKKQNAFNKKLTKLFETYAASAQEE